ncbi:MAG: hypothetical protein KAR03_12685 [Candidatus Thorarchaeota archaeon]|nr:hypothetical protein [Candidatus Thorarchaeota archaeon]
MSLTIVLVLLVLISAALSLIEVRLKNRKEKTRIECLLTANDHEWISIEEIAGFVGVSMRTAVNNIEWGIIERIIVGELENNMFERSRHRNPEKISAYIPYDQEEL